MIEPWIATLRAHMMHGAEHAPPPRLWHSIGLTGAGGSLVCSCMRGVAHGLLGAADRETEDLNVSTARGGASAPRATTLPWAWHCLRVERLSRGPGARQRRTRTGVQAIVDEKGLRLPEQRHSCTL